MVTLLNIPSEVYQSNHSPQAGALPLSALKPGKTISARDGYDFPNCMQHLNHSDTPVSAPLCICAATLARSKNNLTYPATPGDLTEVPGDSRPPYHSGQ